MPACRHCCRARPSWRQHRATLITPHPHEHLVTATTFDAAKALLSSGRFAEARTLLHKNCGHNSCDPVARFYLGVCAGALDGEAAAVVHYEAALSSLCSTRQQTVPDRPLRHNLIRSLMACDTAAAANRALEVAHHGVRHAPLDIDARYDLGTVMMRVGQHAAAVRGMCHQ